MMREVGKFSLKSPTENLIDAIGSGNFDERVSGSVGERDAPPDRLEMLVEIARAISWLPPSEREALGALLRVASAKERPVE